MNIVEIYKYLLLFLAAFIEGPVVAFAAGFLTRLGYFAFLPAYLSLIARDILSDTAYYYIGRFGDEKSLIAKYGKYFKISKEHMDSLTHIWKKHTKKTMFFGKLAYGLSIPIVLSAGLAKMSVRKFWSNAIPVTLIQYTILMVAGYYLGASYGYLAGDFKYIGIIVTASAIVFLLGFYVFNKMISKYAEKEIEEELSE